MPSTPQLWAADNVEAFTFEQFTSLNTQPKRPAIKDNEFSYIENFIPIGDGNMRTLAAEGATLYNAGGLTVIYEYPFNLGNTQYVALFLSDGSAVQVEIDNANVTTIGPAGTFYSAGNIPGCAQWQAKYLIIVSTITPNGYWAWDGTNLYGTGTLSPIVTITNGGSQYTGPAALIVSGGSGTGATFSTTELNGSITAAAVLTPGSGYLLNDQPVLSFSGGGSDTTALAHAVIDTTSSIISAIHVLSGGTGYTTSSLITFTGGGGSGAEAVISSLVNGVITGVTVTNPGSGYTAPPTVAASVGTGASFLADIMSGGITSIVLDNPGTGYNGDPTVKITGDGTGASAVAQFASGGSGNGVSTVTVTSGGSNYTSVPNVTFSGGGGSGAAATAHLSGHAVISISITNPGSGYTSAPTVAIDPPTSGGTATAISNIFGQGLSGIVVLNPGSGYSYARVQISGGNNAAEATIDLMPFGISGNTVETFQSSVWVGNITKASFTAAESIADFSTVGGGGSYPVTDSFLRQQIVRFIQANSFLYQIGDSSINVISNVQTSGTPAATTFNNSNIDPQVGAAWRDTVCCFGRAVVFANTSGVYALYGGAAEKVSSQLDGLFQVADFVTVTPTAAVATIYGIRVYCLNFKTVDYLGNPRTLMACWDGQRWFLASQLKTPVFISTQEQNSLMTTWATDGTNVYPLFQTPSGSLNKVYQTKLRAAPGLPYTKQVNGFYVLAQNNNNVSTALEVGIDTDLNGAGPMVPYTVLPGLFLSQGSKITSVTPGGAAFGTLFGLTATTPAPDLTVMSHMMSFQKWATQG